MNWPDFLFCPSCGIMLAVSKRLIGHPLVNCTPCGLTGRLTPPRVSPSGRQTNTCFAFHISYNPTTGFVGRRDTPEDDAKIDLLLKCDELPVDEGESVGQAVIASSENVTERAPEEIVFRVVGDPRWWLLSGRALVTEAGFGDVCDPLNDAIVECVQEGDPTNEAKWRGLLAEYFERHPKAKERYGGQT